MTRISTLPRARVIDPEFGDDQEVCLVAFVVGDTLSLIIHCYTCLPAIHVRFDAERRVQKAYLQSTNFQANQSTTDALEPKPMYNCTNLRLSPTSSFHTH